MSQQVIQNAAESLYGDERLRSNLTDSESKIMMDWALARIADQVKAARSDAIARQMAQKELVRLRPVLAAVNALAKKPGALRLGEAMGALETPLLAGKPMTREEIFTVLTTVTDQVWQMRGTKPE